MKALAVALSLVALQSAADELECTLTDHDCATGCVSLHLTFAIDRSQFVDPQNPNDPPRRQASRVRINGEMFTAQAIALESGIVGFHRDAGAQGTDLMIVQTDGTARLSRQPQDRTLTGQCTRQ